MGYSINLKKIPLPDYRDMLKGKALLPGRKLLHYDIDKAFELLESSGFCDAEALLKGIGSPKKLEAVSQGTGLSAEYLTLLKRELGGLQSKSLRLSEFPHLPSNIVSLLSETGMRDSEDVYTMTKGFAEPDRLCTLAGISVLQAEEVCALCDFIRINGVGKVFAHILYDAGYRCLRDIAGADAAHLRESANRISAGPKYAIEPLGMKDAQYCIDYAVALLQG